MAMTESILKALMRLFAIVTQINPIDKLPQARDIVESYLSQLVNPAKVNQYLIMFDFYHSSLREREALTGEKQLSLFSVKAIIICEQINSVLSKNQKLLVLTQLLEIINVREVVEEEDIDFIRTISIAFKFDEKVFNSCKAFALDTVFAVPDKENVLMIDSKMESGYSTIKHLYREYLKGKIVFLMVDSAKTFLFRNIDGNDRLVYKGHEIVPHRSYYFEKGSVIRSPLFGTLYYSDVVREFLHGKMDFKINFAAEKVEYHFPNSRTGLEEFTLYEESGTMLGVMGGSGVGKSTLLNILNGNLKPRKGRVLLNGSDIHKEPEKIEGIIGYIPQDDLLIEELTVYQNLYFNAKLCFKNLAEDAIIERVDKLLSDLELSEAKNMQVGNPLKQYISGGQRKRLNIALELIREPFVLFVDEPTSGLSSSDSDTVIDLLKEQSLKGKLVVVNIHQPSSKIYKRFDKLIVMDKGGRIIFHGNPLDALVYFKTENQLINAEDGECPSCGNVNPEQVLEILESKKVNESGEYISERQVSAEEWYARYKKNHEAPINPGAEIKSDLPSNDFEVPSCTEQFEIFSKRNILSKLADKQYLLINILEAPVLAIILAWFTKYNAGQEGNPGAYIFGLNENLPIYIFMSVVVALFIGLMVSGEEVIRDRRLLQRESFLNLSRLSYYNSKIILLVFISAVQTAVFVLVGNSILEIKGMFLSYWLVLFASSLVANLVGLNVSASLKSVVAIYILIPLLLVPQLLLGGAMIRFEKLNSRFSNPQYVPIVGDVMASRWAYEALAVYQFKHNEYQQSFFETDQKASDAAYKLNLLLPELSLTLNRVERNIKLNKDHAGNEADLHLLANEFQTLGEQLNADVSFTYSFSMVDVNVVSMSRARRFIEQCRRYYTKILDASVETKDALLFQLRKQLGGNENLLAYKMKHHNASLEDILLNKRESQKIVRYNNQLIRNDEPVYKLPEMNFGRAHFLAAEKKFLGVYIDTYWFNILILIIMSVLLYLLLITEVLKKTILLFETYNLSSIYSSIMFHVKKAARPLFRNS